MEGVRFKIPFEGGVVEWCVVVEVKRRHKLEVVVHLYMYIRRRATIN